MKRSLALSALPAFVLLLCGTTAHAQLFWEQRPGCATSIGSRGGETWVIGCGSAANRPIYRYNFNGKNWDLQPNSANQITVSAEGIPWVLRSDGSIWKWNGSFFSQPNGIGTYQGASSCANQIAVGFGDDAWITSCAAGADTPIFKWNGSAWVAPPQGGYAKNLGMFIDGAVATPWATQSSGGIYKWTIGGWLSAGAGGGSIADHCVVAQNARWIWSDDSSKWLFYLAAPPGGKTLKQLAGGWAITTDGAIYELNSLR
jgi:hypothetical protein